MGDRKKPHHRGQHQRRAKRVTDAANANPHTQCWRCGRTLAEHPPHRNGRPATWHAGHVIDGLDGGPLKAEASTCNTSAGAQAQVRAMRGLPPARIVTEHTW